MKARNLYESGYPPPGAEIESFQYLVNFHHESIPPIVRLLLQVYFTREELFLLSQGLYEQRFLPYGFGVPTIGASIVDGFDPDTNKPIKIESTLLTFDFQKNEDRQKEIESNEFVEYRFFNMPLSTVEEDEETLFPD